MFRTLSFVAALCLIVTSGTQNLFQEGLFYEQVVTGLVSPTAFEFLDDDTILVNQKNTGQVLVIQDNAIAQVALDLTVSNTGEMGLLGIVKHPDFEINNVVYIYHTFAQADGGAWQEDRLQTYTWDSQNRTLTLAATIATWGPEGWLTSPFHHGGYIKIGPDRKLYVQHGDMRRYGTMAVNEDTGVSGSNAAIYRLELDGSVPADNPFVSESDLNFKRAYVYGMRNAFGMAFDPQTGKLWYTENGPEIYDEINIAEPGMNSGWRKIMGPDKRDASMEINNGVTFDAKDLFMLPGSHYSDPVFSYLTPIGITCIEFLSGTKFSDNLRKMAIMSCTSVGRLFLLPITEDRLGLVAAGPIADLVADDIAERDLFMIGTGWGAVTDARVGPDGYLYVCSYGRGAIYRLRPKVESVVPEEFLLQPGVTSSTLQDLSESDDTHFTIFPGIVFSNQQPAAVLEVTATSPFADPTRLDFLVEAAASSNAIKQTIELFDYAAGEFVVFASANITTADETYTVSAIEPLTDFIEPGTLKMRVVSRTRSLHRFSAIRGKCG
ncbi:MAG: PQQ-dependent sugar dehydrogenase [Armatimonadota bacterium]|nr:PQQ-dependent sugar dehydrogenase [Armatimonadota bacterium]